MTRQTSSFAYGTADAGAEVAQLRRVLALVEQIAGLGHSGGADAELDEAARVSAAYENAMPIVQRRFDELASQTARWAAAGVSALVAVRERDRPAAAAAARLADELRKALAQLRAIVSA